MATAPSPLPRELVPRLLARLIDVVVLVAIDVGLGLAIGFGYDWLLSGATIVLAYFALCDHLVGATPGKRALGLRVVGPDGDLPTLIQAVLREAFMLIGAVPFVGPLLALGVWTWIIRRMRQSPLGQGPHDMLAGLTRVVRVASRRRAMRPATAADQGSL